MIRSSNPTTGRQLLRSLAMTLSAASVCLLASACVFTKESPYTVNAGDSTPTSERETPDPFARIIDRTPVVAFEVGRCEQDADCMPQGCDDAVCAAEGIPATCVTDRISACLSEVDRNACGCVEGVCRWARTNQVLACARLANDVSETRPYEGAQGTEYPWRPYH